MGSSLVVGQTFLETQRDATPPTFGEFQRQLDAWGRQPEHRKSKGWKWIKRWEDFQTQRMQSDGGLLDWEVYARAAQAVVEQKAAAAKTVTGSSWVPLGPNNYAVPGYPSWETGIGRINCIAFHPTIATTFWVGVAQGGVWKTVDDGLSWTPLTDDLPMLRISDICVNPANPDEIYIAVGDMAYFGAGLTLDDRKRHTHYGLGVYKTTDGGQTWNPTGLSVPQTDFDFSLTARVLIHPTNTLSLVAAGTNGIWTSANAGASWTQVHDSIIWDMEMDPTNPQILYASTGYRATLEMGSASIMKSTNFGATWTVLPTGIPGRGTVQRIELAVAPSDPNYVYALCAGMDAGFGGLYRSTNAGTTWALQATSPNILEWWDGFGGGGQGWYDLAIIVNPTDRNTIYTGGVNMWASTDGGVSWNGCSYWQNDFGPSLHADQHQFALNPLNNKYYVCNDGGLYAATQINIGSWDDAMNLPGYQWPTSWQKLSAGMQTTSFYRCSTTPAASGNLIAGAQDNGTYFYNGTTWYNIFGGDGMECILHPTNPQTLYGSSQYGYLSGSNDGGLTTFGLGGISEYGEWTTPFLLHPTNANIMFAAYGNVHKSSDAGNSWIPISNFPINSGLGQPNISSALAISKSNPDYLYVAKRFYDSYGEPSALWVTTNGGATWTDRTAGLPDSLYFTYIAVDADDPATAWVTTGGFVPGVKIFKTTNAGATWANVSLNLPNLQSNCVLHDGLHNHNPIYVGLDVGVYYFNDTLSSWELYATDLPNVIVSELELDAPNQQIVAATFGRGLWGVSLKDELAVAATPSNPDFLTLQIAPNPNSGRFDLVFQGNAQAGLKLELIDVMGRIVHTEPIAAFRDGYRQTLETDLAAGCYFARVTGNGGRIARRFVVE
jgi:photosystem II stability/assembly factor-like uncharacterized protein